MKASRPNAAFTAVSNPWRVTGEARSVGGDSAPICRTLVKAIVKAIVKALTRVREGMAPRITSST